MITEDYVSNEVIELLKEKRFEFSHHTMQNGEYLPTATIYQVMKWLREEHRIVILPDFSCCYSQYSYDIEKIGRYVSGINSGFVYDTYEQACEAAITYVLKNLI